MKNAMDLVAEAKAKINEVSVNDAPNEIQKSDVLIDVREPDEFRAGHIAGAVNIPRGMLEFKLSGMPELQDRDKRVVVYCKTSGRGALAAVALKEMGYLQVHSISGGLDAWIEAGKPTVKPDLPEFG
ncbi:sulfurtransferase [Aliidiomarina iranensis]|uniref:Sulfurtransferase n=1 Tax=Aliidiomarina iranensis TaxID=1434071 RepID=A0A432W1J8_9GAMM|nr:rhodanese-like domain-containing protein [Aliidiomarina iranensis]RUO23104.1 sulfurtransferase [Aliidiomarina iranensis]